MKKLLTFCCLFLLAAACYLVVGVSAQEEENPLAEYTPEGYDYTLPEEESPLSCVQCMHQSNNHLYRAVGIPEPTSGGHAPTDAEPTGIGWISSKHATSFTAPVNNNTYCAYCHAPTTYRATSNASAAKAIKPGKWHGMSCQGCHTTHSIAADFGTRLTNYHPGSDLEEAESYIPRHSENGKQANRQCLFCHGTYHGFSSRVKTAMVDSGSLRCIDCHMAGYQLTSNGTVERFHNMKVIEDLPWSCNGRYGSLISCHTTAKKTWGRYVVPKIMGAHSIKNHQLPGQ